MWAGTSTPAHSRMVRGRSISPVISRTTWPPVKGQPYATRGMRTEASWQERLYSQLRVLKWLPWSLR